MPTNHPSTVELLQLLQCAHGRFLCCFLQVDRASHPALSRNMKTILNKGWTSTSKIIQICLIAFINMFKKQLSFKASIHLKYIAGWLQKISSPNSSSPSKRISHCYSVSVGPSPCADGTNEGPHHLPPAPRALSI